MKQLVLFGLAVYRRGISPVLHALAGPGSGCRFLPTCSEYCEQAIRLHGLGKGFLLALRRLLRCHPWGGSGWDPVPESCGCWGEKRSGSGGKLTAGLTGD